MYTYTYMYIYISIYHIHDCGFNSFCAQKIVHTGMMCNYTILLYATYYHSKNTHSYYDILYHAIGMAISFVFFFGGERSKPNAVGCSASWRMERPTTTATAMPPAFSPQPSHTSTTYMERHVYLSYSIRFYQSI